MKKVLSIVTTTILTLGLLTGCGSGGSTPTKGEKKITLAVWGSSPAEISALEKTIDGFTEKTGIKVEKEVIQDKYMDVMKARFSANNAPDVFYVDSFELPALAETGVLLDQTDSIKDKDDFYPALLNAFKGNDGKVYGILKDYSTLALYVNTDLLAKAGYKTSDIPTDMSGFFKFTKELKAKLPADIAPMVVEKDLARYLDQFDALGAKVVKDDGTADFSSDAKVQEYLQNYLDNKKNGSFAFAKEDLGSDSSDSAFGSQKAVMMIEGNWALGSFAKDYSSLKFETLQVPKINGKSHTMVFTAGYSISKNTRNADNAKEFVNYMTKDGQKTWCEGAGVLPSRKSVSNEMQVANDPLKKAHVEGAEYATPWSRGTTLPILNTNFANQFLGAMIGQVELKDALKAIDKDSNDEIARKK